MNSKHESSPLLESTRPLTLPSLRGNYVKLGSCGWQVVYLEAMALCHCQGHLWTFRRMTQVMNLGHACLLLTEKHHGLLPQMPRPLWWRHQRRPGSGKWPHAEVLVLWPITDSSCFPSVFLSLNTEDASYQGSRDNVWDRDVQRNT